MDKITINFNGKDIEVAPDKTILQVAEDQGVEIPTLCHDKNLIPFGSCFVCVVEIEGMRAFKPACATKVAPGMRIKTSEENIKKVRKMALELLLSNHYADCKAPCTLTCPAGVDVQGYIALIANKQFKESLKLIKETNPMPLSIGRVCTRPCEAKCRRGIFDDEPVAIDYLKRFVADKDLESGDPFIPKNKAEYPEKIAIIGSGPGGLTAAYYLAIEGYKSTVFEKLPKPGGMLRYGIPEYRLPKKILDAEIDIMTKAGVGFEIKCNQELGKDFTIEDLKKQGYKAILFAVGAQKGMGMRAKGEDIPGVYVGVDFLRDVASGKKVEIGKTVAVIGGGNTAMDAARTSLRLGAENVMVLYRRTRNEMPANDIEVEEAIEEGIQFHYLTAPLEVIGNKKVEKLKCIKMQLGEPDESGRRRPIPIEDSEYYIDVDNVIAAIGQTVDLSFLENEKEIPDVTRWNTFVVDEDTMATNIEGIFAIGDAVTGPAAAIDAIAGSGKAAKSIHEYLRTGKVTKPIKEFVIRKDDFKELTPEDFAEYPKVPREKMPVLKPEKRKTNFKEIELGYSEEQAIKEAQRCLECGCKDVFECKLKKYATDYQVNITSLLGSYKNIPVDDSHPFIRIEPNKCINCGRCVRICEEVQKTYSWGFVKRGFDAVIMPSFNDPLMATNCETCGQCVQSCPVGALTEKNPSFAKPGPFKETITQSICTFCSVGCNINIHTYGDKITRVTGDLNSELNKGFLCKVGRFGHEVFNDNNLLKDALIKENGNFKPIAISEALEILKNKVESTSNKLFLIGEGLPLDFYYQIKQINGDKASVFQNNYVNIVNSLNKYGLLQYFGASNKRFEETDIIIILDSQFLDSVITLKIIKHLKDGKKVYVLGKNFDVKLKEFQKTGNLIITNTEVENDLKAINKLLLQKQNNFKNTNEYIKQLEKAIISEEIRNLAQELLDKKSIFIFKKPLASNEAYHLINTINIIKNNDPRLLYGFIRSNSFGWLLANNFNLETLDLNKKYDLLLMVNSDPVGTEEKNIYSNLVKNSTYKIVFDSLFSESAKQADLVIPIKYFAEIEGIYVNFMGIEQKTTKSININSNNRQDIVEIFSKIFNIEPKKETPIINTQTSDNLILEPLVVVDNIELKYGGDSGMREFMVDFTNRMKEGN